MFRIHNKKESDLNKSKKILEEQLQEEKKLEEEVNDLMPEPSFKIADSLKLLKGKSEEDMEYESYLTEDELKEEKEKEKETKKIVYLSISVFVISAIVIIVGANIFYNLNKSELLRITEPLLKEYYEDRYNEKLKVKEIKELTTKDEKNNEIKTGIYLLTTKDDKHLMSVNNELIGDDISTNKVSEEIENIFKSRIGEENIITDDIELSYMDYYTKYNRYLDYINVIPANMSTTELEESNKLTVTYKAVYQNDIDLYNLQGLLQTFSSDSAIYLLKQETGGPAKVSIITKDKILELPITVQNDKTTDIVQLEFDRNLDGITSLDVTNIVESSMQGKDNYRLINGYLIEYDYRINRDEEKEKYYLVRFPKEKLNKNNFVELSTSRYSEYYTELDKEDYIDAIIIEVGSYSYLLSDQEIFIAQKAQKKGFLCNFGIC